MKRVKQRRRPNMILKTTLVGLVVMVAAPLLLFFKLTNFLNSVYDLVMR